MIEIIPIVDAKGLRRFVDFPTKLLGKDPSYVPPFRDQELESLDPARNPASEFCEWKLWMAYRDGKPVGRVCALLNHRYNETWKTNRMRFTRLDFIDDAEVVDALMAKVEDWAREKGVTQIHGPMGFCDLDHQGMLVDGFQHQNLMITIYSPAYYPKHMERLGYTKDVDWVESILPVPEHVDAKVEKVASYVLKRSGVKIITFPNAKALRKRVDEIFVLLDKAYAPLYGTVPLNKALQDMYVEQYFSMVDLRYCLALEDTQGNIVGFGLAMPGLEKAVRWSKGKIFPFGWAPLLWQMKHSDHLDLIFIAVDPAWQGRGLNAVMVQFVAKRAKEAGMRYAETGPNLEENEKILNTWGHIEGVVTHKRRRCYIKTLEPAAAQV